MSSRDLSRMPSVFSAAEIVAYEEEARRLNIAGRGDQEVGDEAERRTEARGGDRGHQPEEEGAAHRRFRISRTHAKSLRIGGAAHRE